jgi:MFS family permease
VNRPRVVSRAAKGEPMLREELQAATSSKTSWVPLAGVIATVSVFAVSQGLSYPLLSFILQRQGISPSLIGLSAAMTPLGFILSAPLIPWLSRRFGAGRTALACAGAAALLLALIGWKQDIWLWFPLRFLLGFIVNPLYVISETWMLALTPPAKRGRIMGVYTSVISAGFAMGPFTLALVGTEGWPPFIVGIAAFVSCALCLLWVLPRLPDLNNGHEQASVMRFVPKARLLLFAVFVAAAFEQVTLALMSVYGQGYGSSEAKISTLLAVFVAGNIALQIPLGMLAERLGSRRALIFCALMTALCCLLLPVIFMTPFVWPVAFVWGAVSFGIYTMALIELGERFSGSMLIAGNAAFAMFWGAGGIAGTPASGAVMDLIGVQGLPLTLGLLCVTLVGFQLLRR